ncbi:54S ribosomal mitochondrial [Chlorella sorokiniana]|uniref:Large ribosomal subunit protein bL28m n=1 Tax=Chlorella sorokiniana TaxID=3076 RepID=A0A2P6TLE9_CHLSO|nr:54S ribosomal mitochondrial [Chlorella sorokiniana]|eukprot:PRW45122.1 54S ribosomal mitochondrial [Chlorella sorokiniana]
MLPLGLGSLTRAVCNRARRGLYAGRLVRFGNQISEDGGNKSRRNWKPNAHNKRLYSALLDKMVRLRVTTAALRDIDKAGGIDAYILNTPDKKLQSDVAMDLRARMLSAMARQTAPPRGLQTLLPRAAAAAAEAATPAP